MNITTFRIDDRLIHGRVVTTWIARSDAEQILVADDAAVKDTLQQSLLKMATPKKVDLKIMSLGDAKQLIQNDEDDTKALLLVRGLKQVLYLIDSCNDVKSISVGNINMKKWKREILGNCWLNDEEEKDTRLLAEKVEVEVRAAPNERKQILVSLLQFRKEGDFMSLFLQAFLVTLAVTIAFIDAHMTQTHIFRPIFIGLLVGAIMEDFNAGLQVGVTVGLMFLAVIFVGTTVPPNPTISAAIATTVAILGGGGTDLAVATALPVSFIGQIAETVQNSVINVWFVHRAGYAIGKLDTRGLVMNNIVFTMATNALLYGVPTFLAICFGADFVADIIEAILDKIITGLSVGENMVGAIGSALLLSSIKDHTMWPFLLLGFFLAAYLQINMVGIVLLVVVFAALYYYSKPADEGKE